MIILGIETSCDETALALLECSGTLRDPKLKVLADVVNSQIETHKQYGGVFPAMAKREHSKNLIPLFNSLLGKAQFLKKTPRQNPKIPEGIKKLLEREPELFKQFLEFIPTIEKPHIDAIAVTHGPGLEPALWVGINFAKALSCTWNIPLVPTNHMEGHIYSVLAEARTPTPLSFPLVALLVSGGHTQLVYSNTWFSYTVLGETKDDAVGEAFDKVARILGLPYPGGPEISRIADIARKENYPNVLTLPRPMIKSDSYDFSYSGLKTAVLYGVKKLGLLSDKQRAAIAREFENAAVEVLIKKTKKAVKQYGAKTLIAGGGVIANNYLREQLEMLARAVPVKLLLPNQKLSTDNAVMISIAAAIRYLRDSNNSISKNPENIVAHGTMKY